MSWKLRSNSAAKLHFIAGIQPSFWGRGVDWSGVIAVPPNVGAALCIYNPSFTATLGLGYARYAAPERFSGTLDLIATDDLHPNVDNDAGVHGLVLTQLKRIAGDGR